MSRLLQALIVFGVISAILAIGAVASAQAPTTQGTVWHERLTLVRLASSTFTDPLRESDVVYAYRHAAGFGMLLTQWYGLRDDPEKVDLEALAAELRGNPALLNQRFVLGTEYWDGPGERWTRQAADPDDPDDRLGMLHVLPPDLDPSRHRYADGGSVLTGWLSMIGASLFDVVTDAPEGERATPSGMMAWSRSEDGSKLNVRIRREHDHLVGGVPLWVTLRAASPGEYDVLLRRGPDERDRLSRTTFEATFERNTGDDVVTTPFRRVQFTAANHPRGEVAWEQKGLAVLVNAGSQVGDAKSFRERFRPVISDGTPVVLLDRDGRARDGVPRVWRDGAVEIDESARDAAAMSQLAVSNRAVPDDGSAIPAWAWLAGGALLVVLLIIVGLTLRRGSHGPTSD